DNPDDSNLQGNFQALLEFRIDIGTSRECAKKCHLPLKNDTERDYRDCGGIIFLQRSSRKLNKPECFLLWLTRQRTFPTKKTCLLSSAMLTLQRIFERSLLVSACVEKKQPVTQSRS
ncbi:unnamed protein product, partial [Porites evermanni]